MPSVGVRSCCARVHDAQSPVTHTAVPSPQHEEHSLNERVFCCLIRALRVYACAASFISNVTLLGPSEHGTHIKTSATRGGYVRNVLYENITLGEVRE